MGFQKFGDAQPVTVDGEHREAALHPTHRSLSAEERRAILDEEAQVAGEPAED
jgi:hypothetical protein